MILCDTDVLIEFLDRGNQKIISQLLLHGIANFCFSEVTASELLLGAKDKTHYSRLNRFIETALIIPINIEISNLHLQLIKRYALSHKLQVADSLIAATALVNNFPLFTLNSKDFNFIPLLKLNI